MRPPILACLFLRIAADSCSGERYPPAGNGEPAPLQRLREAQIPDVLSRLTNLTITLPEMPEMTTGVSTRVGGPAAARGQPDSGAIPTPHVGRMDLNGIERSMNRYGFHVVENAFDSEWCDNVRRELSRLRDRGLLTKEKVRLATLEANSTSANPCFGHIFPPYNGIKSLDLVKNGTYQPPPKAGVPSLEMLVRGPDVSTLLLSLNARIPQYRLRGIQGLRVRHVSRLGSGGEHLHYDAHEDPERGLGLYLFLGKNWTSVNDGHLRAHPFPFKARDIVPKFNRMVLVDSRHTMTRLMPSTPVVSKTLKPTDGWWVCIWLRGGKAMPPQEIPVPRSVMASLRFLYDPKKRLLVQRVITMDEVLESMLEAFHAPRRELDKAVNFYRTITLRLEAAFPKNFIELMKTHLPLEPLPGTSA
mmetsp:Transcript_19711/g.37074  ORF Transcript_19711/g.37074 Transcript_19711/m.37074 type:complete len:416 (-) Transcript_19711:119-1366(-)